MKITVPRVVPSVSSIDQWGFRPMGNLLDKNDEFNLLTLTEPSSFFFSSGLLSVLSIDIVSSFTSFLIRVTIHYRVTISLLFIIFIIINNL